MVKGYDDDISQMEVNKKLYLSELFGIKLGLISMTLDNSNKFSFPLDVRDIEVKLYLFDNNM